MSDLSCGADLSGRSGGRPALASPVEDLSRNRVQVTSVAHHDSASTQGDHVHEHFGSRGRFVSHLQPIAAVSKPEAAGALARPITRAPPARWAVDCRDRGLPRDLPSSPGCAHPRPSRSAYAARACAAVR